MIKQKAKSWLKRTFSCILASAMAASMAAVMPVTAEDNTLRTYFGDGYEVNYSIKGSWDGNQNIEVTLTNTGSESLLNWALKYDAHGEIGGLWNGTVYDSDSTKYIVKNAGYNYEILPEQEVTFGYTLTGDDLEFPETVELCSQRTERTTDGYSVEMSVMNDWDTGFSGIITIQNLGDDPLEAWQLSFDTNFEITDLWNAQIIGSVENHYTVANDITTTPIGVGESKVFGFSASKESGVTPKISDFIMSEITINNDFTIVDIPDDDEIVIFAFGEYLAEDNALNIEWFTSVENGSFELMESYNNEDYITTAVLNETYSYTYPISDNFDTRYFKVIQTTEDGRTAESVPFVVTRSDDGYSVDFLDSDSDGLEDIYEEIIGTDVNDPDTDGDGLTDYQEVYITGTDPNKYDSVTEGVSDADADPDGDGLSNAQEIELGTDPQNDDTDGDGLKDGEEVNDCHTDPLNPDTDGDGIPDGEEVIIGLDPNSSSSDGETPDSERTFSQHIDADADNFSEINTDENPFKVSMDITAAGSALSNLNAHESGYAEVINSDLSLGLIPEFTYTDGLKVEDVVINFDLTDSAVAEANEKNDSVNDDLKGIKRYNVFKYFEDIDMLLPIETSYDEENNRVYTHVDEVGTYCLIDMEQWFSLLGVDTSSTSQSESTVNTAAYMMRSVSLADASTSQNTSPEIDVVFNVFLTKNSPEKVYEEVVTAGEKLFNEYGEGGNVHIYVIDYQGRIINPENSEKTYATNISELEYMSTHIYTRVSGNRALIETAVTKFLNNNTLRENADKYYVSVQSDVVESEKLNLVITRLINENITASVVANKFMEDTKAIADSTGGIFFDENICLYGEPIADFIIEKHKIKGEKNIYRTLAATGWKEIVLDEPITNDYKLMLDGITSPSDFDFNKYADTDGDGLIDLREIRYSFNGEDVVFWDENGDVILPTIKDCINLKSGADYVKNTLSQYGFVNIDYTKDVRILPIKSDPTLADSDGDGELDNQDETPFLHLKYGTFVKYLEQLQNIAENEVGFFDYEGEYTLDKETWLIASFLRSFNYDNTNWNMTGGKLDKDFNEIIKNKYPDIYNYFRDNREIGVGDEKIDIWHFGATLSAYCFKTNFNDGKGILNSFGAQFMPENMIDSLAGWAGDLQSLSIDFYKEANVSGMDIYDYSYSYFYDYVYDALNDTVNSSFGVADLNADIDAVLIYKECLNSNNSLYEGVFTYYSSGYKNKYQKFYDYLNEYSGLTSEFRTQAEANVHRFLSARFMGIVKWPILKAEIKNDEIYCEITDDMRYGLFHGFLDFLNDKITQ